MSRYDPENIAFGFKKFISLVMIAKIVSGFTHE